jgi:hypothetical protein
MSFIIHKHHLKLQPHVAQILTLPWGAEILHSEVQGARICLWEQHVIDEPRLMYRTFYILFTGTKHPYKGLTHHATLLHAELVLHIFEDVPATQPASTTKPL